MRRAGAQEPAIPGRRRRLTKILALVGAMLGLLLLMVVVGLHTPPARRYVLRQVQALLANQQIELQADGLSYNLLDLTLSLRDIRVRGGTIPDGPPFASIGRARVDLGLLQLLRGRYVVESATFDEVSVHYLVDAAGADNLPRPPTQETTTSEPIDYLIEHLTTQAASVRYENRRQDVDVTLPITALSIDGNASTGRHAIALGVAPTAARVQDRTARIDGVRGAFDLGTNDLRIERLELAGEGARLALSGAVDDFDRPRADLSLRATADVEQAARLAALDEPVRGQVDAEATIRGGLDSAVVDATLTGTGLAFRTIDGLDVHAAGGYDLAARTATVRSLQATAPWGAVTADGTIAQDAPGTSHLRADIRGLDAARLMRALDVGTIAATRVDARVALSWPGLDVVRSSGEAHATLTPTAARTAANTVPVGGRLDLIGRDGAVEVTLRDLAAAGASTSGRVAVDDARRLSGALRTHVADVADAASSAERVLARPAGSLLPTPVSGSLTVDARLGGDVAAPRATASVAAPALAVGTLTDVALSGDLAYGPDAVDVAALDVRWLEAWIHAQGRVGLSGRQPLDLSLTAEAIDLPSVLGALDADTVPARGRFAAQASVGGTVAEPAASVTLRGEDLDAYGEYLGTLTARAMLAGQEVTLPELRLHKPQPDGDGTLSASGAYHLETRAYAFDVRSDDLRLATAALPDGRAVRGAIDLRGNGQGTLDRPAGTAALAIEGLQFDDMDLGRVTVDVTVADQQAKVAAAAEHFRFTANGVIGVAAPYPATLDARLDGLDLATLPIELDTRLDGVVRARMEAAGDLDTPERMTAAATIDAFDGHWNDQPFSVTTAGPLRLADERLTIEALRLTANDSTAEIGGELPLADGAAPGAITVEARANLATLAQYAPSDLAISGDGTLAISGTVRGTLAAIDPDLTIAVDDGRIVTPGLEPGLSAVQLQARIAAGVAEIETLSAAWGAARLEASGRVPFAVLPELPVEVLRQDGPAQLEATLRGLDLATVPGAPAGLTGLVGVEARISAASADLAAVDGRIVVPDLEVAFDSLTLAQAQPMAIGIAGGVATLEPATLSGSAGTLSAAGTIGLLDDRTLDLTASGTLDMAALAVLADGVRAEGAVALEVAARGTTASPDLTGTVTIDDGRLAMDEPRVAAENLAARIDLAGSRLQLATLTADVNGGTLEASGGLSYADGDLQDVDLRLATRDFAFDAPLDLRSISAADLRLGRRGEDFVLDGTVTIDEAGLTGDINFDTGLLAAINSRRTLELTAERNPLLERVRFDVRVVSATPVFVDNNLARAEATLDVRVLGTPYDTGMSGQLTVLEGGEITLNERRYSVTRGVIAFVDDRRIVPSFDLELSTAVRHYDITLGVTGPADDTETTLTSDPALPEPDIMAMLITGRPLDEMRGEEYEVVREQVLSQLTGRVGSSLGRGLQNATGLTNVRIEPNLIANEANPSARLTVGQSLTEALQLIYSTDLTNSNDQIWVAQYDVTRRFQAQTTRQSDDSYRLDARHDVRFGGTPEPRRLPRHRPTIASLELTGDQPLPADEMRRLIRAREGRPLDYFALRDGIESLEERLRERGFLQSRVRLQREVDGDSARLRITVTAGPPVDLRVAGIEVPRRVLEEVRTRWHRGVFDTQRTDDGVEALRGWLMSERYLQPTVEPAVSEAGDRRQVVFQVTPGPRYERVVLAFEGASGVDPKVLDAIVDEQDLEQRLFTDPLVVTELLQRYYREQGYLSASIDTPRYDFEGRLARVILTVQEGPLYHVRAISMRGNQVLETPTLVQNLPVAAGDPFLPFAAENALRHLRDLYWRRGYNDATTDYELAVDRERGEVDVAFSVREGRQSVVADVVITGQDITSDRLAREQIDVQPSQPLDLAALNRSRRALYDIGAFSVVDVRRRPLDGEGGEKPDAGATAETGATPEDGVRPVRIEVNLREVQPFRFRYGLSFDTERGLGGIADLSNHNSLGSARVVGLRTRYDGQIREGRLYMNQPSLRALPVALTASVYYREERNPATELTEAFNVDRRGLTFQGETTLRNAYVWNYGYRYERTRSFDPDDVNRGELQTVAPLTSTFTREQRDDVLDASRGSFTAHAFSYSPTWLGSSRSYVRYLGQYFHYFPLQAPGRKRFTNEILRPRLVFATGVRIGVARGIGGEVPLTERFFAGGSTTLRGFAQNAVGPIGANNLPQGGEGMLLLNAELRAPLLGFLDGVVFADVGNVYARLQDFSLTQLRESAGVGLRIRTPWFLLRGDYGVVLDRRPGEGRGRFFFSIGQAF